MTVAAVLVAAALVAYAACLGMAGSRMLGRARWTARAPLLAIVVYLAAGWSVIAALGLAGWRGPPGTGGTGWSASRSSPTPTRSWTWTAIPSR